MKIDIWSDVVCPFCYIGEAHMEQALAQFGEHADITYHAFRLAPGEAQQPVDQMLARKYGLNPDQVKRNQADVEGRAAQAGLEFHLSGTISGDTIDAHRLVAVARAAGKQVEMINRLHRAYFTEGCNIFDRAVLHELGAELGLTAADIDAGFASAPVDAAINQDIRDAQAIGIRGVPFFVVDNAYAISGAQPVEAFVKTFEAARQKAQAEAKAGDACSIDSCD